MELIVKISLNAQRESISVADMPPVSRNMLHIRAIVTQVIKGTDSIAAISMNAPPQSLIFATATPAAQTRKDHTGVIVMMDILVMVSPALTWMSVHLIATPVTKIRLA